jgi:hypothetical protein
VSVANECRYTRWSEPDAELRWLDFFDHTYSH